jgi:hypothetical protein
MSYPNYGTPGNPNLDPYYMTAEEEAHCIIESLHAQIAALTQERDDLIHDIGQAGDIQTELLKEIYTLRVALKPFAEIAAYKGNCSEDDRLALYLEGDGDTHIADFCFGDFWNAARAIAKTEPMP